MQVSVEKQGQQINQGEVPTGGSLALLLVSPTNYNVSNLSKNFIICIELSYMRT
jgi:hypothetical protein